VTAGAMRSDEELLESLMDGDVRLKRGLEGDDEAPAPPSAAARERLRRAVLEELAGARSSR
jgi:hypothetical protein